MRQKAELVALRWQDVDLDQAVIRVRRSFTGGQLGTPKNRERRDVDLITDVVDLLRQLEDRRSGGDALVFSEDGVQLSLDPSLTPWPPLPRHGRGEDREGRSNSRETHLP